MEDARGYLVAVGGVGLALVAFAIAAGIILGSGHDPTQSFWTIASGLSGALIGILAPSPSQRKGGPAAQAAAEAHNDAATAAQQAARAHRAVAVEAQGQGNVAGAAAASRNADLAAQSAANNAEAARDVGTTKWSFSVAALLVLLGVCEFFLLFYHPAFLTPDLAKQLQALAAAAGGGAIGLLAPSPAFK